MDEIEYETENFTDAQKKIVDEIQYNNNLQTQMDYQLHSLRRLGETLVVHLKELLIEESDIDKPLPSKTKKEK